MPRVLRQAELHDRIRTLAAPDLADDPAVAAAIAAAVDDAYARGVREGQQLGHTAAAAERDQLGAALGNALARLEGEQAQVVDRIAANLTSLAVDIAEAVVGTLPEDAVGVAHRVAAALGAIDDRPLEVRCAPSAVSLLEPILPSGVTVTADVALEPGEARVVGTWADADLTWQAIWEATREALDVG